MSTYTRALVSARSTYRGFSWIYVDLISPYAKNHIGIASLFLILAIGCVTAIPYAIRKIIDAKTTNDTELIFWWLGVCVLLGTGMTIFGALYDHFREKAWNNNYFVVNTGLLRKLMRRTLEEINSDKTEISAEQIESLKDRVQNILYLVLFETSQVFVTILMANIYIFTIDVKAGLALIFLTAFNLVWFFYFNAIIDRKMTPIDTAFRKAQRRLIEKMHMATSVKAGGVEEKISTQAGEELAIPLASDLYIWAYWFLYADIFRRFVNVLVPPVVLFYGLTMTSWTVGEVAAIATWSYLIAQEYGFIGHLMRHMTSQIARIKAARLALSKEPSFNYDEGIIYERNDVHAH